MSGLDIALSAAAVLTAAAGWLAGRSDTWLGCAGRLDKAYDRGWDESALAGTGGQDEIDQRLTVVLDSGRGAAGDGPAPPPGPPMIDPDCRDGKHGSCVGPPCECSCHSEQADDAWADTLGAMRRELAAEAERPASHTDQFHAIFSRADGLERQVMLTWDLGRRYDRTRPEYLREMGIPEKRIRELLGAD